MADRIEEGLLRGLDAGVIGPERRIVRDHGTIGLHGESGLMQAGTVAFRLPAPRCLHIAGHRLEEVHALPDTFLPNSLSPLLELLPGAFHGAQFGGKLGGVGMAPVVPLGPILISRCL